MDGFERMSESGAQGRDGAVVMKAFVGRSSASTATGRTGTSRGMETLREFDDDEATRADGVVVRKEIEQDSEHRVDQH